jgi:hypothetical protein
VMRQMTHYRWLIRDRPGPGTFGVDERPASSTASISSSPVADADEDLEAPRRPQGPRSERQWLVDQLAERPEELRV